ncbi:MAG: hypothetical protein KC438_14940, partial [Thermomicrobiales bacterium]|nr:hypothetical protein [Thermomicrobiales bacterium]
MRRVKQLALVSVLSGMMLATGGGLATAQDATPGAIDLSPNPELCNQPARTLEEIQAIAGTPAPAGAGEATAAALDQNPQEVELPTGEPAPKEAIDGVVATIVQNIACYNAGDYLAGFGGVTEEFLVSQVGVALFDEDFVETITADPVPLPEELQTQLLDTREFTLYEDGRVGVLVYYISATPQPEG